MKTITMEQVRKVFVYTLFSLLFLLGQFFITNQALAVPCPNLHPACDPAECGPHSHCLLEQDCLGYGAWTDHNTSGCAPGYYRCYFDASICCDPCFGVSCNNYCDGTTRYYGGQCVNGECRYSTEPNAPVCGFVECGDGIPGNTPGEECDDGNTVNDDGCDNNCRRPTTCNATCQATIGCTGFACTNGQCRNSSCAGETDCICSTCGDGNLDPGEMCDDGNNANGDGCEFDCSLPNDCNDVCDDGQGGCLGGYSCVNGRCRVDTCSDRENCICPECGDGDLDAGEECDDGNNEDGDGCSADCRSPRECNETCTDEIGCRDGYFCSHGQCRNPECTEETDCACITCGNGVVDAGEECDDANTNNDDDCTNECRTPRSSSLPFFGGGVSPRTGAGLVVIVVSVLVGGLGGFGYYAYKKGWLSFVSKV